MLRVVGLRGTGPSRVGPSGTPATGTAAPWLSCTVTVLVLACERTTTWYWLVGSGAVPLPNSLPKNPGSCFSVLGSM